MQVGTLIKGFWLEAAGGTLVEYRPGDELLLVFSFHATLSCRHRNRELDPAVRSMAGWAGVRVWDVVVGGCSDDSFVFAARHELDGDRVLHDPTGEVAEGLLHASPLQCWLLLDEEGRVVYHGRDVLGLEEALGLTP
ncbi:MAG: hypothetical protein KC910_11110 [Candidatus Eremiobacteraeota bacterium]|nr:hypothetical protein [Candidatus Eremiobacteraeota bacterium]